MGRAWVFGDVYGPSSSANSDAVAAMIDSKWQAGDIVVLAGDCVQEDPPTTTKYNSLISSVLTVLGVNPTDRNQVLAVPGNHDYDRGLFNTAFGVTGDAWSSHVIAGARWILLDSMNASVDQFNPGVDSAQLTWLDAELASPFDGPTFAVMHHPRKSSYTQTSPDTYNDNSVLDSLYSRLYNDARVDRVFHGHCPFFEITKKLDHNWAVQADGFRQVGTGTGGWSHATSSASNNALMDASDASGTTVIGQHHSDDPGGGYGATLVEWDGTLTTLQYFSTDGTARYTLTNDPLNNPDTGGGGGVPLTVINVAGANGDVSKVVPLAANAGTDRQAILVVSWQGAGHNQADMGTAFGPLTLVDRVERGTGAAQFVPGIAVYAGAIPAGTQDFTLPTSNNGVGFGLLVCEGADLNGITATISSSGGTLATSYTAPSGSGFRIGAVSTNSATTVTMPGNYTTIVAPGATYSAVDAGYDAAGNAGTFTFGSSDWAGVAIAVPVPQITYTVVRESVTPIQGTIVGAGLGTDVNSTDPNGITITAGGTIEFDIVEQITEGTPASAFRELRVELPAGYDPAQGYKASCQAFDMVDAPISVAVNAPQTIIGGEPDVIFTTTLPITGSGTTV